MTKEDEMLEELKKIRELLTPVPPPPVEKPKNLAREFLAFIKKFKILGLASAFILGLAVNALILSLAQDMITPIIGIFIPGFDNIADIKLGVFGIGNFIAAIINFIIIAVIIFLIVKLASRIGLD
ncbi:MAG: MscL family protein [Candidatus Lokiarchaeota archaeon]|nr:MscL family protein [Candidatus Lokiarchaeota archaeon]